MTELIVTTDIYSDIRESGLFPNERHLDAMMAWSRSIGASGVDWILDDMWALYESYPGGGDLLAMAIEAAHAHGLRFSVVYKPDEGRLLYQLPHTAPRPDGVPLWEDLRGLIPIIRPFPAAHPEMCLKRRPGDEDPGGKLTTIRLIKNDNDPVHLSPEDISIWISDVNGRFEPYTGRFSISQDSAWRPVFPMGRTCRVVAITGLSIPSSQRYVEVRLAGGLTGQRFCNEYEHIVELVNDRGQLVPCSPALADPPGTRHVELMAIPVMQELIRYGQHPQGRAFLNDPAAIAEHAGEMRKYAQATSSRMYALDEKRHLAVARGKIPYVCGVLNPVYPEVREHWLDAVRFSLDRGADAVDIRVGHHARLQEDWAYGYNEPVLEALGGQADMAGVRRVIGDAFTQFLRQARELVHSRGKLLGVHLLNNFLVPRDEPTDSQLNEMDYQWETWVAEIADFATIRAAIGMRDETIRYVVDRFAGACRAAGIPVAYQSNRRVCVGAGKSDVLHLEPDRLRYLAYELEYVLNHRNVTGFQLYETAYCTRMGADGLFEGSEDIREVVRRFGFGSTRRPPRQECP